MVQTRLGFIHFQMLPYVKLRQHSAKKKKGNLHKSLNHVCKQTPMSFNQTVRYMPMQDCSAAWEMKSHSTANLEVC